MAPRKPRAHPTPQPERVKSVKGAKTPAPAPAPVPAKAKKASGKRPGSRRKPEPGKANAGGRPTKLTDDIKRIAQVMYRLGATDKEFARAVGVTEQTVNNWKKQDSQFFESLSEMKAHADREVERSLYEKAIGYSHSAVKHHVIDGAVVETPYTERYPPSDTAAIFWLKNRQPKRWRDKQELEITDSRADLLKAARERAMREDED